LYDNLYFDQKNGNLIEVNGISSTAATNKTNITNITVIARDQSKVTYSSPTISDASKKNSVSSSFAQFIHTTTCDTTDKYKVIYICYSTETILHIFKIGKTDADKFSLVKSILFTGTVAKEITNWTQVTDTSRYINITKDNINTGEPISDTENKNIAIKEDGSDENVAIYKMSRAVFYDVVTGNLVLKQNKADGSTAEFKIYNRKGEIIKVRQTPASLVNPKNGEYYPWIIKDPDNNLVIVNPYTTKTVICILKLYNSSENITLGNIIRFNGSKVDNGQKIDDNSNQNNDDKKEEEKGKGSTGTYCDVTDMKCLMTNLMKKWFPDGGGDSDEAKWLAYWNLLVSSGDKDSNDYILKTQIVPPVCPQCPSCNCNGVCSDCGGNGGSGLKKGNTGHTGHYNSSITNDILNKKFNEDDNRFGNNVGQTVSNISGDVTGLAGSVVGTAGGIVNNAVNTAGGLLYSAGSGATNLLRSAGGNGPVGLDYQNRQGEQREIYYSSQQGANTPIDNYSQYGALQSRGGNYMPVTADFSAFGK
jgi:hypothetical protein